VSNNNPANTPVNTPWVATLPGLSRDFWKTFTSGYVQVDGIRFHTVTGGHGPVLLLMAGWPQTWYAWRHIMPALARSFQLVVLDPRGVGLSDKPVSGYDSGTLAADAVGVMRTLGHNKFALVTHDVGSWTGYALASDYPDTVERFVAMDMIVPGLMDPGLFLLPGALNGLLWHFPFNRTVDINERLIRGREEIFFEYQFTSKTANPTLMSTEVINVYIDAIKESPEALHSSFEFYRAIDVVIAQNAERKKKKLALPVLAVGGERGVGEATVSQMRSVAQDVKGVVIPNAGHYILDENAEQVLNAVESFLAPYRS
jgi:pimeloyl-ACP methyl ester carboxylesterase